MDKLKMFREAKHCSGFLSLKCSSCKSRINRHISTNKLEKPGCFGLLTDDPIHFTHEASYSCKCGKTVVLVEGSIKEYDVNGCFLSESKHEK